MRFVTYTHPDDGERVGVLDGDVIHALEPGLRLLDLLGDDGERLDAAGRRALTDPRQVRKKEEATLLAPLPQPPTVRDFMVFEQHVEGVAKLADPQATIPPRWYEAPAFYFTNPYAIIGPDEPVPIAPGSRAFDLELEVAAVIGRPGTDLTPEQAESHIAGYTILIDWSARDIQFAEMQVPLGPVKGKDTATTLGPALVTPDELASVRRGKSFDLAMTASVNGTLIGQDSLASMAFSFAEMAAYASRGTWVKPGDVLGSGTCGGGCLAELWGRYGRDAHPPLASGDTVTVTVERLGAITARIA
ncbi:fumarylacetoacetate hydrolase family protein [Streptomyces sp. DG2A-72]|uniref:fumarylacetoacetate hydrolase family protein n=1 Tax=Streptomyces sp. DG2A-72 TaxID=3051386 RepID=UPI00265BF000|nr:fumarylacetoacetate hydrolase family protein [Streptomyces sp. DG2A-72]MDO0932226.1 fumarylacetoacetate hydrolase family protein [Streptomyces sp. DG2A-72]